MYFNDRSFEFGPLGRYLGQMGVPRLVLGLLLVGALWSGCVHVAIHALRHDEIPVWSADIGYVILSDLGAMMPIYVAFALVLRSLGAQRDEMAQIASTDHLTRLLSRRSFEERVTRALNLAATSTAATPEMGQGAFLMLDIDHFKHINDRFGHDYGDQVLEYVSARMKAALRRGDLCARLGGEEFGAFLPDCRADFAAHVAERLRSHLRDSPLPVAPGGVPVTLTVSIGLAHTEHGADYLSLYRHADLALYHAKAQGRNLVAQYDPVAESQAIKAQA